MTGGSDTCDGSFSRPASLLDQSWCGWRAMRRHGMSLNAYPCARPFALIIGRCRCEPSTEPRPERLASPGRLWHDRGVGQGMRSR